MRRWRKSTSEELAVGPRLHSELLSEQFVETQGGGGPRGCFLWCLKPSQERKAGTPRIRSLVPSTRSFHGVPRRCPQGTAGQATWGCRFAPGPRRVGANLRFRAPCRQAPAARAGEVRSSVFCSLPANGSLSSDLAANKSKALIVRQRTPGRWRGRRAKICKLPGCV